MPSNPPMQLVFPAAGVVRRFGLRSSMGGKGAFPTPWSMNVRLEDAITDRLRGGSFTGITKAARVDPVYRDRAITFSGNAITATRVGDHTDTTLSADVSDTMRPVLFQLALADVVGGTVVAICPHKDSYLLCWTATETWVLSGDPATGAIRRVSDEVGIVAENAWCVAHDTIYFLSSRGLYQVNADGSGLKALSEDVIPEDLIGVTNNDCSLTYQHSDRGVYVHTTGTDWFYDTERGGFWPFDANTSQSHLLLGPLHLGADENSFGRILNLQGNVATGSADVTCHIVPADTAEEAAANGKAAITAAIAGNSYSSYVHSDVVWSEGRSHMAYPRTRAVWVCLWLAGTTWAYEAVAMTRAPSGAWR